MKRSVGIIIILSVLLSVCKAQDTLPNAIASSFENYTSAIYQEKVYLHSDRNAYLAGELIWFKVYNTDAATNNFSVLSKVLYVELIDAAQRPVLQSKIGIKNGSGNGSLFLPVTLTSGTYVLRAYTSWMRNFNAELFFEKVITVHNVSSPPVISKSEAHPKFDIQFFPEGGNLVDGADNKVAFRVTGKNGMGVDFDGAILNLKNDTIVRFTPLKFGIGNFILLPRANERYRAVLKIASEPSLITTDLPLVNPDAYSMLVQNAGRQIHIRVNGARGNSRPVRLFVHSRNKVLYSEERSLTNGSTLFSLDEIRFSEGISHITVFDASERPVAERLYFKRPVSNFSGNVSSDHTVYSTRSLVELNVTTRGGGGDMSVTVYKADSTDTQKSADIFQYQWLTSELKGVIENPEYYFKMTGTESDLAIDNLLLTHGWRRFKWDDVFNSSLIPLTVVPEFAGHIITGKITDKRTGKAAPGIMTFLSVPSKKTQIYSSRSDGRGDIKFFTKDLVGPNELVVQTNVQEDSTYTVVINSPFSESIISSQLHDYTASAFPAVSLKERYISVQVQNAFVANELRKFHAIQNDSTAFYGKPESVYNLNEFIRFRTTEEVLREYVPSVVIRRQRNKFDLIVDRKTSSGIVATIPLIILDGVPIFDRGNKIIAYDQAKIQRLEVSTRNSYLGDTTFNSIINFTTFKGNLESFELDARDVVIDYEGLQLERQFFSPVYETPAQKGSRLPDVRQLLYWSANVKTNEAGKNKINFYTSDQAGKYIVLLEGIAADGSFGSRTATFEVK